MEIPQSPRTPPVTNRHVPAETSSAMTKDKISLLEPTTADGDLDNPGRESENTGSVGEECEEDEEKTRSHMKARTISHVHGKRAENNSNKKKPVRKRRVTANLSGTKYDVGEYNCIFYTRFHFNLHVTNVISSLNAGVFIYNIASSDKVRLRNYQGYVIQSRIIYNLNTETRIYLVYFMVFKLPRHSQSISWMYIFCFNCRDEFDFLRRNNLRHCPLYNCGHELQTVFKGT